MANEKMKPQSPEEIARATQEAALEQMRAMMGSIPGMPDMGDMQAQIMAQMQAAVPDLAEIQAQQAAMGTLGGVDAAAVAEAARQNMAQAAATMQAMQDGSLEKELREANAAALAWLGEDDGWAGQEVVDASGRRYTIRRCWETGPVGLYGRIGPTERRTVRYETVFEEEVRHCPLPEFAGVDRP